MKVCIVGAGLMGKGLAQIFAQSSEVDEVLWFARSTCRLDEAVCSVNSQWDKQIAKNKLTAEEKNLFASKFHLIDSFAKVEPSVGLIIEAIKECLPSKLEIFAEMSRFIDDKTMVASNSSSLSITEIASVLHTPGNVVGMHFFNPPAIMKLVEIVVGIKTSVATIERAKDIARMLGKEPIEVKEAPGFIVNRMLIPMINEAIGLLAEGIAPAEDIDKAMMMGANHPIGPLALADLIGNDVVLAIMDTLRTETGDPKYRPHPLLRKMVRANLLGRKVKSGFFSY